MFYRLAITLTLGLSYLLASAQYDVAGKLENLHDNNAPIPNHPVFFFIDSVIIDTVYTNIQGSYSFFYDGDIDGRLVIKTVGFCDSWEVYTEYVNKKSKDITIVNFEICHVNSEDACSASFAYENLDSTLINFSPDHDLAQLMNYEWVFGDDENFSNDQNPQYQYPEQGIYTVQLITTNPLGCHDTSTTEILVGEDNFIRGQVSIPGNYFSEAAIQLISVNNNMIEYTVYPNDEGKYELWYSPENYIVKVIPEVDFDYLPRVMPTYYGGTTNWKDAITVTDRHEIKDVDINVLTADFVPVGLNKIYVKIVSDVDMNLLPIGVYLLDEDMNYIDFGEREDYGRFVFDELPVGTYYVKPECPGRISTIYKVEFEYSSMSVYTEFEMTNTQFQLLGINDIDIDDNRFDAYPVPMNNRLHLNAKYPISKVLITDEYGRLFSTYQFALENNCTLQTQNWPRGIYFIKVLFDNQPPGLKRVVK